MFNLRPFEIVLIAIFSIFAVGGLMFFANYTPDDDPEEKPFGERIVVWGTFDSYLMNQALTKIKNLDKRFEVIRYEEKDARTFQGDFIAALAEGTQPDIIMLPHSMLVENRKVLMQIPFDKSYTERNFRDTYLDGAEIFMLGGGIYGVPFAVDPLVMYWNRDILSSAGLANPPRTWESLLLEAVPSIVRKGQGLELRQNAIAFGEYANVTHGKEILSMLLLQAGSSIVESRGDSYAITLNRSSAQGLPPGEAALTFYTQFASPSSASYSWNRAQDKDRNKFLAGTLALYFAPGSEYEELERGNPNLNFDIAQVPQQSTATAYRNFGTFYGFAIPTRSSNRTEALRVAFALGSTENARVILDTFGLAAVQRSLAGAGSQDPYQNVIFQSALTARGWYDPSPSQSDSIFRTMVEEVTAGRKRVLESVNDSVRQLELLFR